MTGFELREILTKADNEVLRNDVYAGESQCDRVIDAYLSGNNIVLETEMQAQINEMENTIPAKRAIGG